MKKLLVCSLSLIVTLCGCDTAKQVPREIVIVPDVSASIDPAAERQMFAVIEDVARHLRRGDSLTIIPITSDAEAELQGRTLHYVVPPVADRQAYDSDVGHLQSQIKADLERLQSNAEASPEKRSDIIGSIEVAMKEFSTKPTYKQLVVLSDFIQDDQRFNFLTDLRLRSTYGASALGRQVAVKAKSWGDVRVILGRLKSEEFSALSASRQGAINAFWGLVMSPAEIDADGTANVPEKLIAD